MTARITLIAKAGPLEGRALAFISRTVCTVGRSDGCLLRIQGDPGDLTVSRQHCLLDIDLPAVRVRDLGSLNGTFVNGRKIGQREKGTPPREAAPADLEGVELHDGDWLAVGSSEFLIAVPNSPPAGDPEAPLELLGQDSPVAVDTPSGQPSAACR